MAAGAPSSILEIAMEAKVRSSTRLGLPTSIRACLFDLDGVLTQTAATHAAAWKEMFDGYLRDAAMRTGSPFVPFDRVREYREYVDGKTRTDGVRSFLESRGIDLPEGREDDSSELETINGLANRKNARVVAIMRTKGVDAFPDALAYVHAVRDTGLLCAVVSGSTHCGEALAAAEFDDVFAAQIDGCVAARTQLRGKPAPDTFLAAARAVGAAPAEAAVFEDSLAGIAAAREGGFGYVVGVDRGGDGSLRNAGADIVVSELTELLERQ
jgi:beta-phosphoglucomutase family hydrolase